MGYRFTNKWCATLIQREVQPTFSNWHTTTLSVSNISVGSSSLTSSPEFKGSCKKYSCLSREKYASRILFCLQYASRILSCLKYASRTVYCLQYAILYCLQYASRILYCLQYASRILYCLQYAILYCLQYTSRICMVCNMLVGFVWFAIC